MLQSHAATVVAIHRHPIKGFTPEALDQATLSPDVGMAFDRAWAVENGPSGFDPLAPAHISKMRFVALAPVPGAALIRTRLDDSTGRLHASTPDHGDLVVNLDEARDRARLEHWLSQVLGDEASGPLKVVQAPGHRFLDDPAGQVSIISRASLRALETHLGRTVDPLRLRGNLQVEGLEAFAEVALAPGTRIRLGEVETRVIKPIRRCIATHVDPATGERDIDLCAALHELTGHTNCGVYVKVASGGTVHIGDTVQIHSAEL
jgi:uncharacterized protein YcbX